MRPAPLYPVQKANPVLIVSYSISSSLLGNIPENVLSAATAASIFLVWTTSVNVLRRPAFLSALLLVLSRPTATTAAAI
jgi:hypothetical protein